VCILSLLSTCRLRDLKTRKATWESLRTLAIDMDDEHWHATQAGASPLRQLGGWTEYQDPDSGAIFYHKTLMQAADSSSSSSSSSIGSGSSDKQQQQQLLTSSKSSGSISRSSSSSVQKSDNSSSALIVRLASGDAPQPPGLLPLLHTSSHAVIVNSSSTGSSSSSSSGPMSRSNSVTAQSSSTTANSSSSSGSSSRSGSISSGPLTALEARDHYTWSKPAEFAAAELRRLAEVSAAARCVYTGRRHARRYSALRCTVTGAELWHDADTSELLLAPPAAARWGGEQGVAAGASPCGGDSLGADLQWEVRT
jgi:hypothetical protein